MSDHQKLDEARAHGFWPIAFQLLLTPVVIQAIVAVALILSGSRQGFTVGLLLLWYIVTALFPVFFGESLNRRFGTTLGTVLAFAPLWLPGMAALFWLMFDFSR